MSDIWALVTIAGPILLAAILIDAIWRDGQKGWPHSARRSKRDAEDLSSRLGDRRKSRMTRSSQA